MTLRLVLAVSLDGRLAPPVGGAAQLGGSGDRLVLEEALAWADVAVVGADVGRVDACISLIAICLGTHLVVERSQCQSTHAFFEHALAVSP